MKTHSQYPTHVLRIWLRRQAWTIFHFTTAVHGLARAGHQMIVCHSRGAYRFSWTPESWSFILHSYLWKRIPHSRSRVVQYAEQHSSESWSNWWWKLHPLLPSCLATSGRWQFQCWVDYAAPESLDLSEMPYTQPQCWKFVKVQVVVAILTGSTRLTLYQLYKA